MAAIPAREPYKIVMGNNVAIAGIIESDIINQSLYWIGFTIDAQCQRIMTEAFGTFEDIRASNDADIDAMAKDFSSRTMQNGRISFGMRRTKLLKGFAH